MRSPEYKDVFITEREAIVLADAKSLLVVVDTSRPDMVESKSLLLSCTRVAVVDHHRRAAEYIDNAVLNFDDPRVARMASVSPCPVLGYAVTADAEVRAEEVELDRELRPAFRLVTPWGKGNVHLAVHGVQQVSNALAAASAALWCGVPLDIVVGSLEQASGSPLRMEVRRPANGPILLVDCYNANPASTEAALRSLAALPGARRVAMLGLMAELGAETAHQHAEMAALAQGLGIEVHGYQTDLYGPAVVPDVEAAVLLLRSMSTADAALLKGSRVARLEDVVEAYGSGNGDQSPAAGA